MSEIKPALSATGWEEQLRIGEISWWHVLAPTGPSKAPPLDRFAVAALCLHEQEFGFTREMGNIVRWAAEIASSMSREPRGNADPEKWKRNCRDHMVLLRDVADRIEALLPPEN